MTSAQTNVQTGLPAMGASSSSTAAASSSSSAKRDAEGAEEASRKSARKDGDSEMSPTQDASHVAAGCGQALKSKGGEGRMEEVLSMGRMQDDMKVVRARLGSQTDVAEVYSPPRVVTVAEAAGLRGGFSLDLTTPWNGEVWDFTKKRCRTKAIELLRRDKPYLLIGSPPCTAWSNLQSFNELRPGGKQKVEAARNRARIHLLFCVRLYKIQLDAGRYFLHEHPRSAKSWQEKCVQSIINHPLVMRTEIDQCAYGLQSRDGQGEAPAKTPTSSLTNSAGLRDTPSKRCPGCCRHVKLVEGRAAAPQIYSA